MDQELFAVLAKLPVAPDYLTPILPYYESNDSQSLTAKIRSIQGFKGIKTPMTKHPDGWQPDLTSRYFQEDFMHGLRYIYDTAHKLGVETPTIDHIYKWGEALAKKGEEVESITKKLQNN